jgi:hypothetical protein
LNKAEQQGIKTMRFGVKFLALLAMSTSAHATWREAESKHFIFYGNGSEKELQSAAQKLESVHFLLGAATGIKGEAKTVKVKVYIVSDTDVVKKLLFGKVISDVAGFYSPSERGAYAVVPKLSDSGGGISGQAILFHEYAHHYMMQYMKGVFPSWFVEGFAEVIAPASFERKGSITFGKVADYRQYELAQATWIPYPSLINGRYQSNSKLSFGSFYGQSWLLTHYLLLSNKRPGQLRQYMTAIFRGASMEEAAKVFGDLNQLSRELSIYFEGRSFPYKAPQLPADLVGPLTFRELSPSEVTFQNDRIRLDIVTSLPAINEKDKASQAQFDKAKAEREAWITALRQKVSGYGEDPIALEIIADAECAIDESDKCFAASERYYAAVPDRPHAMVLKANTILARASSAGRSIEVKTARDLIAKARLANPDDPQPLIAYYRSFATDRNGVPDDAIDALRLAVKIIPQVTSIRIALGRELIAKNSIIEAYLVLAPVAFSPHKSQDQQRAADLLETMLEKSAKKE